MRIRDRIRELRRVRASELRPSPRNWRTHPQAQLDALRGVLAEVGMAGAALARELEDGSLELIDGHARAEACGDPLWCSGSCRRRCNRSGGVDAVRAEHHRLQSSTREVAPHVAPGSIDTR
jgi:ParB/Sulfiredoxin domain